MQSDTRSFIPAAGYDLALPLYDTLAKLLGVERTRGVLIAQADLAPGQRVLDIGCGTGSLIIAAKRLYPDVDLAGVDPDPRALNRCEKKARRAGVAARFEQAFADALPFPAGSFDRVLSSFMFHHLGAEEKRASLREVLRVLKPGGRLHLLDLAAPEGGSAEASRPFLGGKRMRADRDGSIVGFLRNAGFADASEVGYHRSLLQTAVYYRASTPA